MKTKRIPALILVLSMALALLSGCSNSSPTGAFSSFSANTLDGSAFTQKDIAAKDATVINFWATFCGPCLAEMPDLAAYAQSLPENVQLITVCLDGAGNPVGVKHTLDQAGFQGITLLDGDENFMALCQSVQAVPTTVFVDSSGNTVGDVVIGGQKDLAASFTQGVNQVLKASGKAEISIEGK